MVRGTPAWLSNHYRLQRALTTLGVIAEGSPRPEWTVRPLVYELTKALPFEDYTVSAVYGSHVLEHLYLVDAQRLLSECKRVLRPGGVIRLELLAQSAMIACVSAYAKRNVESDVELLSRPRQWVLISVVPLAPAKTG